MISRSKIITISIYAVAAAAVLYFAYGTVKSRYFSGSGNSEISAPENAGQNTENSVQGDDNQATGENQDSTGPAENQENADSQDASQDGSHLYVTSKDCDKDCDKFKDNADDLKYCQEVCGIIPASQKGSKDECADLEGLEKDYCLRDVAVSKTDMDICEEIKDARIKKVCKNRIVEDLLE